MSRPQVLLIDHLDEGAMLCLKEQLKYVSGLMAASETPQVPSSVCLCTMATNDYSLVKARASFLC